ncbi:MAG: hypothetical protein IV107_23755, partial [Paucibacter sp.]|nr:hypothetical protein [Roseateles sp.]
ASPSELSFDQPSAGQARASKEVAAADAKRADTLEKQRLKQEALSLSRSSHGPAGIDGLKLIGVAPAASASKAQTPSSAKSPKAPNTPKKPKPPTTTPKAGKTTSSAG